MSLATSLYDALTGINVPKHQAREVVEALEHKMTEEFATKSDIALVRGDISLVIARLERHEDLTKAEFAAVRTEMAAGFAVVRTEMTAEFAAVRTEMTAEFAAVRTEMTAEFAAVRAEMAAGLDAVRAEMSAEFAAVRAEMSAEFAAVRAEMAAGLADVRHEMQSLENRIVFKLGGLMVTLFGLATAALSLLT